MWQHASNIVIGLILIAVSFALVAFGMLAASSLWILAGAGLAVAVLAFWGLVDEISYESKTDKGDWK